MKADINGSPLSQFAARIGYLLPTQRREAGKPAGQTCRTCDKSAAETYTNGWGGCGVRLLCLHPASPGEKAVVTRDNAVCDCWVHKPADEFAPKIGMRYPR